MILELFSLFCVCVLKTETAKSCDMLGGDSLSGEMCSGRGREEHTAEKKVASIHLT